jgi:hypothetical protein
LILARRSGGLARSEPLSDTAAALRGDAAAGALLHQAGVPRFRGGEELFDAAGFFESQPLRSGREIGIVSYSPPLATLGAKRLHGERAAGSGSPARRASRWCWGSAPGRANTPQASASCSAMPASTR